MAITPNACAQHASGAFNRPDPEALLAVLGDDCIHLDTHGSCRHGQGLFRQRCVAAVNRTASLLSHAQRICDRSNRLAGQQPGA